MRGIGRGILGRGASFVEVVNEGRVIGVGFGLVGSALGPGRGIAVVEEKFGRPFFSTGRDSDPSETLRHERIEFFEVEGQDLSIGGDEAEVAAIRLYEVEGQVARMQAHEHHGFTRLASDLGSLGRGVEGELGPPGPLLFPPIGRGGRDRCGEGQPGKHQGETTEDEGVRFHLKIPPKRGKRASDCRPAGSYPPRSSLARFAEFRRRPHY